MNYNAARDIPDGNYVVRVRAQVMMRDDSTGGWLPMGGGGLSNVSVKKRKIQHEDLNSDQPCKHEYLIYGRRICDQTVVLSCTVKKDFEYNKVMPTFHHWKTGNKKFGLTFQTAADARAFDKGVRLAIEDLLEGASGASPIRQYNLDVGEDDVFMQLDLPVEKSEDDSRSPGLTSSGRSPSPLDSYVDPTLNISPPPPPPPPPVVPSMNCCYFLHRHFQTGPHAMGRSLPYCQQYITSLPSPSSETTAQQRATTCNASSPHLMRQTVHHLVTKKISGTETVDSSPVSVPQTYTDISGVNQGNLSPPHLRLSSTTQPSCGDCCSTAVVMKHDDKYRPYPVPLCNDCYNDNEQTLASIIGKEQVDNKDYSYVKFLHREPSRHEYSYPKLIDSCFNKSVEQVEEKNTTSCGGENKVVIAVHGTENDGNSIAVSAKNVDRQWNSSTSFGMRGNSGSDFLNRHNNNGSPCKQLKSRKNQSDPIKAANLVGVEVDEKIIWTGHSCHRRASTASNSKNSSRRSSNNSSIGNNAKKSRGSNTKPFSTLSKKNKKDSLVLPSKSGLHSPPGDDSRRDRSSKTGSCQKMLTCEHCHELFYPDDNHRGSCTDAPSCIKKGIETVTCLACAKCLLYHCMADSEGDYVHPCECSNSDGHIARRWLGLTLLSFLVPCLCCYWPLIACYRCGEICKICGGRHHVSS